MPDTLTQAFALGVVSGMRSTFGPAFVSHQLSQHHNPKLGRLDFLRSPRTANLLKVAAAGEAIGDKLPQTPARTQTGPLVGRALSGALGRPRCKLRGGGRGTRRGGRELCVLLSNLSSELFSCRGRKYSTLGIQQPLKRWWFTIFENFLRLLTVIRIGIMTIMRQGKGFRHQ